MYYYVFNANILDKFLPNEFDGNWGIDHKGELEDSYIYFPSYPEAININLLRLLYQGEK